MNKIKAIVVFISGAAIGSAATWYYTKKKYESIATEEINSVKEVFSRRENPLENNSEELNDPEPENQELQEKANLAKDKPNIIDYASKIQDLGYSPDEGETNEETEVEEVPKMREDITKRNPNPYVISPDDFAENEEYDVISITYYADKILADDNDELIEDVEGVVGFESLSTFGDYDDNAVFVRNERLQTDFEILLDPRKYLDVLKDKPYLMEV